MTSPTTAAALPTLAEVRSLLAAIGTERLTEYFEFFDRLRDSGATNMYGGHAYLIAEYPGMSHREAKAALMAWAKTKHRTAPAEDRADDAIEQEVA